MKAETAFHPPYKHYSGEDAEEAVEIARRCWNMLRRRLREILNRDGIKIS
jgi:HEPN domain-containing protein